jgi:hypothetical protein
MQSPDLSVGIRDSGEADSLGPHQRSIVGDFPYALACTVRSVRKKDRPQLTANRSRLGLISERV